MDYNIKIEELLSQLKDFNDNLALTDYQYILSLIYQVLFNNQLDIQIFLPKIKKVLLFSFENKEELIANYSFNKQDINNNLTYIYIFKLLYIALMSDDNLDEIKTIIEDMLLQISNSLKDSFIDTNIKNQHLNSFYLKDYLIYNHKLKYECAICGLNMWQNNYLMLQLDYIDGNFNNQNLDNLRLLCPNCFSQMAHV